MKKKLILTIFILISIIKANAQERQIDSLLSVYNKTNDLENKIKLQNKLLKILLHINDSTTQHKYFTRLCNNKHTKLDKLMCNFAWQAYYLENDQNQKVINLAYENFTLLNEKNSDLTSINYFFIINAFAHLNEIDSVKKYFDKFLTTNYSDRYAFKVMFSIVKFYEDHSYLEEANEVLTKLIPIAEKINDRHALGMLEYRKAGIYRKMKDYKSALQSGFKAAKLLDSTKNKFLVAANYYILSLTYSNLNDYNHALQYLDSAGVLYKQLNDKHSFLLVQSQKALTLSNLNQTEKGKSILQYVINERRKEKSDEYKISLAYSLNYYGINLSYEKKYEEAIKYFKEAKKIAKKYKMLNLLRSTNYNLRECSYHLHRYKDAHDYLLEAYKYKDSILKENFETNLKELEVKYQTEKKEKEILQLQNETKSKQLALEKNSKKIWILGITLSAVLLFFILLGFFYYKLKQKKNIIELLQRDLHHRVKNNLSIISAFVDDLLEKINDPELKTKLIDLNNRIQSINELHRQLYKDVDITGMSMRKYVDKIARMVQSSYGNENIEVKNLIDNNVKIDPNRASLLGLVINEFITNSFKHAFEKFQKGKIFIELIKKDAKYILRMKDNGAGLPDDFHQKSQVSFGMDIFNLIAKQLNGKMHLSGKNGVELIIEFTA